jgi:hypothetical protein
MAVPDAQDAGSPSPKPSPWPWIVGGLIVAAAVIGAVLTVLNPPPPPDPSTPEGTAQAFLQAIDDEDYESAYGFLQAEVQGTCTAQDLVTSEPVPRTVVTDTVVNGDEATVFVRLAYSGGDPLGGSYESDGQFELVNEGGSWAIVTFPWPYTPCSFAVP